MKEKRRKRSPIGIITSSIWFVGFEQMKSIEKFPFIRNIPKEFHRKISIHLELFFPKQITYCFMYLAPNCID